MRGNTELIYFVLTDRFHSGSDLLVSGYSPSNYSIEELLQRRGGTLRGIIQQLPYVQALGCTAIWLNPVMENSDNGYHGYAIRNFLQVDPRLGTMEDLKELIQQAHERNIKVYLDIVLNHTADLWSYDGDEHPEYSGQIMEFGSWKSELYPIPQSLRDASLFARKGRIKHWDSYPETREGDIFELKKLITDGSEAGKKVRRILLDIYLWWIRETDADGFRVDTIKHLSPATVQWFCQQVRMFTQAQSKPFCIFGEAIGSYSLFKHYSKLRFLEGSLTKGLDRLLDFPLHFVLPEVISGVQAPHRLVDLLKERQRFISRMNATEDLLIGFLDNHDQVAQSKKARIHAQMSEDQVLKAYWLLHFICPVVQLYYGTEQGMSGQGMSDVMVREPMFDDTHCAHAESSLYKRYARIHRFKQDYDRFYTAYLHVEYQHEVLRMERVLWDETLVLVYNFSAGVYPIEEHTELIESPGGTAVHPGQLAIFR